MVRLVLGAALVLAPAGADARPAPPPEITVQAGAAFPMFLIYEVPGPWAAIGVGWRMNAHLQLVANADTSVFFADGIRRYNASLGAGVRVAPWHDGPWLRLGVGTTGYVERVGVVLPEREVRATDIGAVLTADVAVGIRVLGWELGIGWDHIVGPRSFYSVYSGTEAQPYRGTAMAWIGRQL